MKSKLVILSLMLAGAAMTANAQTKEKYVSEKATDNIFVSVTGGISMTNSGKSEGKFGSPAPHITVSVGKWINPVWAIRAQGGLWRTNFDTFWSKGTIGDNGQLLGSENSYHKNVGQLRLDAMFNISNAIWGYNPDRLFNLSVFAGPGLTIAKGNGAFEVVTNETSGTWYKKLAGDNGAGAYINGSVGLQGQAQTDLASAKNAAANVEPEVREVVKEVQVAGPRAIFFKIGSARLDDYGKVNIKLAAKILKENPDKKYKVAGYADKATGSASWNQKLSEKRAQVVYDALIAEGVDKDQLELVGFGGTENMFGKNFLNRVVILE